MYNTEFFNLEEQLSRPISCVGCQNYHGKKYQNIALICAIHPQGWIDFNCPDFSRIFIDNESIKKIIKIIQPNVEIVNHIEKSITLEGNFISLTGTDDIEYFIPWKLKSASFFSRGERRTYIKSKN